MKTNLIPIILCFTITIANSQIRQHGLIVPKHEDASGICCIYSPKEGFKIFNSPNGKEIGVLTRTTKINTGAQAPYRIFFIDAATKSATQIDLKNFKEIGYEVMSITYFARKDGYVRVVNQSFDYWISEKEIISKDFKVVDWQEFFIDKSGQLMGLYANEPGLALKAEPKNNSVTKKSLKGDLFEIAPTKECNGKWTKVKVKKYKKHPCGAGLEGKDNIEFEIEGWIEIIDNDGQPNLWYYSRGC